MRLKHILLPTDFDEGSERAEAYAVELATKFDAKITLLHVWSIPRPSYGHTLHWPTGEVEGAARDVLGHAYARLSAKYPNSDSVLVSGVVWDGIVRIAKQRDVDMIVIGTHGRTGLSRVMLGSVAERVVRLSSVPVLAVGPLSGG